MKKTGLFKILMFTLLGILVLTWIFSASYYSEGTIELLGMYNIGFFDYFQLLFSSFEFAYFIQIFILLVSIGALYGVMEKTGRYRTLVEKIANNLKGSELIFLLLSAFVIAALTSLFDYGFALFIFIPFILSIILAMGYDKITACVATFGSMLVGTIGSTLGYNTTNVINSMLELANKDVIIYKIALFVLSIILLFVYLSRAKIDKKGNKNSEETMFLGEKAKEELSGAPIIVIFSILFVLLVLGCTSWVNTFEVDLFTNIHSAITEFSFKMPYFHITAEGLEYGMEEVALFQKIIGTINPFGEWYYAEMAVMCLIASGILGLCCCRRETGEAMAEGAKKMIKPGFLVMLAYCVIYFVGNTMFFTTIAELLLSITDKFNIFFSTIVMILGSALHVDVLYLANYLVPQVAGTGAESAVVAILTQGIYGVTMLVAPTSAVLILGLTYLNISFKEWIKGIWKFVLALFAIVIVVTIIAMLII